ncbi:hypothetical protein Q5424_04285 [Conexibacter sp. JD483]|uniref:hypothetical protein n=1 Tax=unclassified Conexibacter TaxID=2627773 RepID=UPI00271BD239|nr:MULTISPECIES: hypothetical protein [unclassified Conexibacter]MDO8184949.1 hypothetical protein [Conexibacter sp. CPCC 205706]MDO8198093.1 hypothetical protein [Conexibacter sp. CPCC 205762]MDR9368285.1 hypothetical protein [Conexibacter sp. JD483]
MHRPALALAALSSLAAVAVPTAAFAASANKAKVGVYADTTADRGMTLQVTPKLNKLRIFQVACLNDAGRPGGTINVRNVPIKANGTFKIDGTVRVSSGFDDFKTKMLITGRFQANRVVGTSTARGGSCGTVRFNGRYYGNAQG